MSGNEGGERLVVPNDSGVVRQLHGDLEGGGLVGKKMGDLVSRERVQSTLVGVSGQHHRRGWTGAVQKHRRGWKGVVWSDKLVNRAPTSSSGNLCSSESAPLRLRRWHRPPRERTASIQLDAAARRLRQAESRAVLSLANRSSGFAPSFTPQFRGNESSPPSSVFVATASSKKIFDLRFADGEAHPTAARDCHCPAVLIMFILRSSGG